MQIWPKFPEKLLTLLLIYIGLSFTTNTALAREPPKSWTFLGLSHLYDYASSWLGINNSNNPSNNRLPRSNHHHRPYASALRSPAYRRQRILNNRENNNYDFSNASGQQPVRVAKSLHYVPGQIASVPSAINSVVMPGNNKLDSENNDDDEEFNEDNFEDEEGGGGGGQWPSMEITSSTTDTVPVSEQQQQTMIDDNLRQFDHMRLCEAFLGTVPRQLELCRANAEVFWRIREAAQLAVSECKRQFQNERWNCSTSDPSRLFGQTLKRSSKEEAFVSAISSAAVVHSVVKACSSGNLSFCSCDKRRQQGGQLAAGEDWRWGGCSDDLRIGEAFAEAFVDAPQKAMARTKDLDIHMQIDLHNNAAGRMIIKQHMQRQCRCHGLSGSCEIRTCWEQMPSFKQIGRYLKAKYDKSIRVGKRFKKKLRRRGRAERFKPIADDELVYLRRSPNYCDADPKRGIFGTQGRVCNRTSTGPDSCDQLCCGRGYATRLEKRIHRCDCKFVWCCEVRCKTCMTETEVYICM